MSLPKEFLDEIRLRVPLSDVIGRRAKLIRAGREFKACCPFHKEKTPSFTVNDQKGFYHCFGCGAHGDVFAFLMNHDNLPFRDAVEQLAALAGLQVPQQSTEEIKRYERKKSLYELVEDATKFFEAQLRLPENSQVMDYLLDRGLDEATIAEFRLGYSPKDGSLLRRALEKQGYKKQDMIDAGVLRKSNIARDPEPYSFFRDRLMFPVADLQNRVVAFGGRIMPESHGGPGASDNPPPKYINSSDNVLFHKGRMLYNQSLARQAVAKGHKLIVVEGYMDVIALSRFGFKAAVAPLGTALTENQVLELWKMDFSDLREPVLCFDGDNAGQRAAARALERVLPLLKPNHSLRFAFLQQGQDPDSLLMASGVSGMKKILQASVPMVDMLWQVETNEQKFDTPESRAGLKAKLRNKVQLIPDRDVQNFYFAEVDRRLRDYFTADHSIQKKYPGPGKPRKTKGEAVRPMRVKPKSPVGRQSILRDQILLATMVNYPALFDELGEKLGMLKIQSRELDNLRQTLILLLSEKSNFTQEELINTLNELGYQIILDKLLGESVYLHAGFARPEQDLENARLGWINVWEIGSGQAPMTA